MVFYSCAEYKSLLEPASNRLKENGEAVGDLLQVEGGEGFAVAKFSWGSILVPSEFANELRELVGKRVSILKMSGIHVRDLTGVDNG